MLHLKLALKRLALNGRSTLSRTAFFGLLFTVIIVLLMFLAGTDAQMKRSLRTILGDAMLTAREAGTDLSPVTADVRERFGNQLTDLQEILAVPLRLSGDRGMAQSLCLGVEGGYSSRLDASVAWRGAGPGGIEPGTILLEASVAESLACELGDLLTIQWTEASSGRMNTAQASVGGIFVGSSLIFSGASYISIADMRGLVMQEGAANRLSLSFRTRDEDSIRQVMRDINETWYEEAEISSVTLDPTGGSFGVYKYYNMLVSFVLWMLIVIFFVIMNYSNQNLFFTEYRSRREELVTFLTFGMKPAGLRKTIALEALFQALLALAASWAFSALVILVCGSFEVTQVKYADLITAMGGPRMVFAAQASLLLPAILLMTVNMIMSALKGAGRYLRREIREIAGTTD